MLLASTLTAPRDEAAGRAACEYGPLASPRKRVALACRCAACALGSLADRRLRELLKAGQAYADRTAPLAALTAAVREAEGAAGEIARRARANTWSIFEALRAGGAVADARAALTAIDAVLWALGAGGAFPPIPAGWNWVRQALADARTAPACDPAWRTTDVLALARAAQSGETDVLPILADALQEAGCDDDRVLGHCRDHPAHTHRCWVPDLILDAE